MHLHPCTVKAQHSALLPVAPKAGIAFARTECSLQDSGPMLVGVGQEVCVPHEQGDRATGVGSKSKMETIVVTPVLGTKPTSGMTPSREGDTGFFGENVRSWA